MAISEAARADQVHRPTNTLAFQRTLPLLASSSSSMHRSGCTFILRPGEQRHCLAETRTGFMEQRTYTGLAQVLGPERAETLMSQLPRFDPEEVATKADLAALRDELRGEMGDLRKEFGDVARKAGGASLSR